MPAPSRLADVVATFPSLLIGYSGGVDSTLLAVVARRVLGRAKAPAAIGVSASFPEVQHAQARALAAEFDLELIEIATGELDDPDYVANHPNRCFFCKRELWSRLGAVAQARGLAAVADGTNADDLGEHRPGYAAGRAAGVRSPLAEAGYTKDDVRREARELGLPIWDAPAAPCLSSRIVYGLEVTPERLRQVEAGETFLRALGVAGNLRVRHRGGEARIEVAPEEFGRVRAGAAGVARAFRELGFARVVLDLQGYRRGSLLGDDAAGGCELLAG